MVKLRLKRMGKIDTPFYRIVVLDSRKKRDGAYIESLGHYDPKTDPLTLKVDTDKAIQWLQKGAQPSDTVRSLLRKAGVLEKWHNLKNEVNEEKEPKAKKTTAKKTTVKKTVKKETKPVVKKTEEKPAAKTEEKPAVKAEKKETKPVVEKVEEKPVVKAEKKEAKPVAEKVEEKPEVKVEKKETKPVAEKTEETPVVETKKKETPKEKDTEEK